MTRPVYTLELDDATGSGTWPTDISNRFRLSDGWSMKCGRGDGQGAVEARQLEVTLKNNDGALTRGGSLGTFRGQRIRLTITIGATVSRRFTGYVKGWPVAAIGGPAKKAQCRIIAFDRWPRMERQRMDLQVLEEVKAYRPLAYYPLNEPSTAKAASNYGQTGKAPAALAPLGYGAPPVFGGGPGVGPAPSTSTVITGQGLRAYALESTASTVAGVTVMVVVQTSAAPNGTFPTNCLTVVTTAGSFILNRQAAGQFYMSFPGGGNSGLLASVADGKQHLLMITLTPTALTFILDGAVVAGPVAIALSLSGFTINSVTLGETGDGSQPTRVFSGNVAHAAVLPVALSAAQAASMWSGMNTGGTTDAASARATRLLTYAGVPSTEIVAETSVLTGVPAQATDQQGPLPALQALDVAEGGLTFTRGDGKIVIQNRQHRALQTAAVVTVPTKNLVPGENLTADDDDDQLLNYFTGTRALASTETAAPQMVSQDATSIGVVGYYSDDTSNLLVPTDQQVQDYLDWRRTTRAAPGARMGSLKVDAYNADSTLQALLLGMEISDRVAVGTGYPTQLPAVGDLVAEGWTESGDEKSWQFDINATPWSIQQAWVLGHATYGLLGSTSRLGY